MAVPKRFDICSSLVRCAFLPLLLYCPRHFLTDRAKIDDPPRVPCERSHTGSGRERQTSFRAATTSALPMVLRALGEPPEAVFAEAGVDPDTYAHPENRIEARALGRLFSCASARTGREDIALLVVDGFRPEALGLIGEVVLEGPDLRTALRNLTHLLQHNTLAGYPGLLEDGSLAMVKFELRDADFPGAEYLEDGAIGIAFRLVQSLLGTDWRPDDVHLARAAPHDTSDFARFFGAPVRFSATEVALVFPTDDLGQPVSRERRRRQATGPAPTPTPVSERVRREVAMRMGLGPIDAQAIADALDLSRRQLFRELREEGTTVQALVDEGRFARARHLLAVGNASLAEIAFALGFPDQSAFSHAFKRWAGTTPRHWRQTKIGLPSRSGRRTHE